MPYITKKVQATQKRVQSFLDACCTLDGSTLSNDLYEAYRSWDEAQGRVPLPSSTFQKALYREGFKAKIRIHTRYYFWEGLSLKEPG